MTTSLFGRCNANSSSTASVEALPSSSSLLQANSGHLLHSYPDSTGSSMYENVHHLSPFSLSSSSSSSSLIRSGAVLKETFVSRVIDPGTSISLKCTAYGNPLPQVTWTLDGSSLHESTPRLSVGDFVTKSSEVISYVNITNAGVEDGGLYACMAANEVTSAIHSGRIDISGDPFIRPIKDKIAIEGSPLLLTCPYAGHPIDEVYWEHSKFSHITNPSMQSMLSLLQSSLSLSLYFFLDSFFLGVLPNAHLFSFYSMCAFFL